MVGRGADADRTMALQVDALVVVIALERGGQLGIAGQHLGIDRRHQLDQVAVQRHLGAVHVGHRLGKQAADVIG